MFRKFLFVFILKLFRSLLECSLKQIISGKLIVFRISRCFKYSKKYTRFIWMLFCKTFTLENSCTPLHLDIDIQRLASSTLTTHYSINSLSKSQQSNPVIPLSSRMPLFSALESSSERRTGRQLREFTRASRDQRGLFLSTRNKLIFPSLSARFPPSHDRPEIYISSGGGGEISRWEYD